MTKTRPKSGDRGAIELKKELEKGLASGVSKRSPAQIRDDFRKVGEVA